MKGNRKKREKKNLFEQEEQENEPQHQSNAQQPNPNTEYDPYNAAKLEENQIYINKSQNREGLFKFDMNEEKKEEEVEKVKKEKPKKKKKLFVDSDQDNSQQNGQEENQLEKTDAFLMFPKQKQSQEVYRSEENLSSSQKDDDSQQKEKEIKEMVQKKKQAKTEEKNLQLAINQIGNDDEQRKKLLMQPLEPCCRAVCYFKRNSSAFSQNYFLLGEDERPLIFCQNQRGSIGANFYFSLTKQMNKKSSKYLGKLRGNAAGSTYQLFDSGLQPSKNIEKEEWRTSLAYVDYENNFMGINGPRKFKVILPNVESSFELNPFKYPENENLSMQKAPFVTTYKNKQPRWNERLKSYALNFGGRVKQASIKNFILVEDSKDEEVSNRNLLVFGKVDDSTFSLEYFHPLSPFQAFGIAVSQFDFKLNCE